MYRLPVRDVELTGAAFYAALNNRHANPVDVEHGPFEEDVEIVGYDGDQGKWCVVARLITGCLTERLIRDTAEYFRKVKGDVSNAGKIVGPNSMMWRERKDNSFGHTKEVPRSIRQALEDEGWERNQLGWWDKSQAGDRISSCRETNWTLNHPEVFEASKPFVAEVERVYREELPKHWREQTEFMRRVSQQFKYPDSVYSTITVNKNIRASYHTDANDFRAGMGNLIVLEGNDSCELVIPRWGVAFRPRPTDILLMDVHQLHGNLPIVGQRLTAVLYAREHLDQC